MNQILKELYERKSVRDYENRPIEAEKRESILGAALQAPSAGNMTLYSIIEITDQDKKNRLAVTCDNQPFIAKAPLVLVFCTDYKRWHDLFLAHMDEVRKPALGDLMLAYADTYIATQNAVTAAQSLGIGSCYIGDILERYEIHRELFELPDYVFPAAMLVFGYPTKQQKDREKPGRLLPEQILHENTYHSITAEEYGSYLSLRQLKEDEPLDSWIQAFCKRKWNSDFSREMSRSVKVMMDVWMKE